MHKMQAQRHNMDSLSAPPIVVIPEGSFWMGSSPGDSDAHDNEKPGQKIYLPEYGIGRYPVTNSRYALFVAETGRRPPEHWNDQSIPPGFEDHPVVNVCYEDVNAYCRWLSERTRAFFRLPTEEEWEKAARGAFPSKRRYPWGNSWRSGVCNTKELGENSTTSVHEFELVNRSPFGVLDMAGNVWEWTDSWYERYPGSPHESLRFGRKYRVVRGGSWNNSSRNARISCRGRYKPDTLRSYLGFRIASDTLISNYESLKPIRTTVSMEPIASRDLVKKIVECFNDEEFRSLCFDLGVNYDLLGGYGLEGKARELFLFLDRRGRLRDLCECCKQLRPQISWPDQFSCTED